MARAAEVMERIGYFDDTTGRRWLRLKRTREALVEARELLKRLSNTR